METLAAVLAIIVAIALLFELARRIRVPYPTVFVIGGLALGFLPGLPKITLEPELVLLLFLPPLLFEAALETPIRDLRTDVWPIARLSILLVALTIGAVAIAAHEVIGLDWAAAFTLGAILGPTDAIAATSVFRRIPVPRRVAGLVEGESLFNDATALVAYRTALLAAVGGTFVALNAFVGFVAAVAGGIAIGAAVGIGAILILRKTDDPPVEVLLGLVVPFVAYLPADVLGVSGVLAAVTAGLIVGSRIGTILSPNSRVLWLATWKMVGFVLNGFAFVLIGLQLPDILAGLAGRSALQLAGIVGVIVVTVIATRMFYVGLVSIPAGSVRGQIGRVAPRLAWRLSFVVGWSGLRGAVSLAAALALPEDFPERNLVLLVTFAVIIATLVGQGLTLPAIVRWAGWNGVELDGDELNVARAAAYEAGLAEIARARAAWGSHGELFDRLESSLRDRTQHLATEDPDETADRRQERIEHEEIQHGVIEAQRAAVIDLRDRRAINDRTLRLIERDLDLEELRMEA
ncbi:MAG TPA: Na+/H+ antiporter [Candidatus Limnocylindrales bacterium]|nr:Na+/H+ antiporter [Candidatus Limnocylindrales bacterium]